MNSHTVKTPTPDPPRVRCVACDEVAQIEITVGYGLVSVFCRRCRATSFIQEQSGGSDR